MNLYDDPTVAPTAPALPAAGAPGYFTDGAPGSQAPTTVRAWIMNAIVSELVTVILGAGLTPDRTNNGQLLAAINALLAKASIGFTAVQQGGGTGQTTTKLYMGVDGNGHLLAQAGSTNLGQLALMSDLAAALQAIDGGAPQSLNTFRELADAIGDDPAFAATVAKALATRAPLAAPVLTIDAAGNFPTGPTPPVGDITSKLANMAALAAQAAAVKPYIYGDANGGGIWHPTTGWHDQWGVLTQAITAEGLVTVTFPYPFDFTLGVLGQAVDPGSNSNSTHVQRGGFTNANATFRVQDSAGNNVATAGGIAWRAWGQRATKPA